MASYRNESNLTKAIKLSRLSETSMVCLLLNALTECNYHAEVKKLEVILDAPPNYWTDNRTSKMAIDLATKLDWDASAVSRVIANANNSVIQNKRGQCRYRYRRAKILQGLTKDVKVFTVVKKE